MDVANAVAHPTAGEPDRHPPLGHGLHAATGPVGHNVAAAEEGAVHVEGHVGDGGRFPFFEPSTGHQAVGELRGHHVDGIERRFDQPAMNRPTIPSP